MNRDQITARLSVIAARMEALGAHQQMTRSQSDEFGTLRAEFEALMLRLDEMDQTATRDAGLSRVRTGTTDERTSPSAGPARRPGLSQTRGAALDRLEVLETRDGMPRDRLDRLAALLDNDAQGEAAAEYVAAAGSDAWRSAFDKMLRNPTMGHHEWSEEERAAFARAQTYQRAMGLTGTSGGFLVPTVLDPTIAVTGAGTSNANLRAAFTVKAVAGPSWTGVTSAGVTAEWAAEAAQMADASPVLAQPTIATNRADAFVPYSFELGQDSANIANELLPLLLDAKDRLEAAAFVKGSGSGQPRGIATALVAAGKTVATGAADTVALGDLYALKAAVPARWRGSSSWLVNDLTVDRVRRLGEGTTGTAGVLVEGLAGGNPATMLGRGITETSELDTPGATAAAGNDSVAVFGDLRQYLVIDRLGATVELVPQLFGAQGRPTGQRGLILWWRVGGDMLNADAARLLRA